MIKFIFLIFSFLNVAKFASKYNIFDVCYIWKSFCFILQSSFFILLIYLQPIINCLGHKYGYLTIKYENLIYNCNKFKIIYLTN